MDLNVPLTSLPVAPAPIPSVDVIIVNWNAGVQLNDCLLALSRCDRSGFTLNRVVVVDNASTDGSLDAVHALRRDLPLRAIKNVQNRGFAVACNQGARESSADYLLFLNPDTRVETDALVSAIAFMEATENADTAVCGAQLVDETGTISRTCARRPTPRHFAAKMLGLDKIAPRRFETHVMDSWDHRTTQAVDHVMGAFYLVRTADFEQMGGFDERFFVYLEDLDLSVRLRNTGRRIVYLTAAQVFHKGGGSSENVKAARLFYALHSRILYGFKHFSPLWATLLLLGTLLVEPWIRVAVALLHGSGQDAWNTIRGTARLWMALPSIGPAVRRSERLKTT
ncbi:MAG: glycosyltransferase family 2 protein [Armatimonadota bacterium]